MKLAIITDQPTVSRPALKYIDSVVAAVHDHVFGPGEAFEWEIIPAVTEDQPGKKAPPVKMLRTAHEGLVARVAASGADRVVTLGAAALNAWENPQKPYTLRKQHGRMRLANGLPTTPTVDAWRVVRAPDLHRDFAGVIYKAVTQDAPLQPMDIELVVCQTVDDLSASVAALEGATVIGVDVETTGLMPYREDMLALGLGAVYDETAGLAIIVPSELMLDGRTGPILDSVIWRPQRRSVGHNFKFDMQFIQKQAGWMPEGANIGDTLLLAHLLDERPNRPTSRARGSGLKDLVAQRYDYEYGFDFGAPVDLDELYAYLGDDVVYTARMWLDMEAEAMLESSRLLECHDDLLREVSRVIARAEYGGAPVDLEWVYETMDHVEARARKRQTHLMRAIGPLAPTMVVDNILAPQQIANVMYDEWGMTPDVRKNGKLVEGDRSTDADHIKAAVAKYRTAKYKGTPLWRQAGWLRALVELRKDIRLASTYQKSIVDRTDDDGRVRASFLLHGASTGRISSAEPNLQNVPAVDERRQRSDGSWEYKLRDGSWTQRPMRRAFAAPEGYQWVEVDYSQLELRVAAGISGDKAFQEVFRSGRDIHTEVAAAIFSKAPADVLKGERFLAKAVSFGILYGRSAKALAEGNEMDIFVREMGGTRWTEDVAKAFIRSFLASYPDLEAWITRMHMEAPVKGYVESPTGRRRRFPMITDRELGSIQRQAVNTPIQAHASDICLAAMVRVQDAIDAAGLDAGVLFPVHDSICLEVRDDLVPDIEALTRSIMEVDFMGCPLKVDFEYGPNWADVAGH